MKKSISALPFAIALALSVNVIPTPVYASISEELRTIIKQSSVSAHLRYRLESVDQDNSLEDAIASSLPSRLTIANGKVLGFSALLQSDNLGVLDNDNHDCALNKKIGYSMIADTLSTDINKALLRYQNNNGTTLSAGRQLVNQLNQCF